MKTNVRALVFASTLLFVASFASHASAQSNTGRDLGIGLMIGSPTALSVQKDLGNQTALNGALGMGFLDGNHVYLHGEYLRKMPIGQAGNGEFLFHYGLGAHLVLPTSDSSIIIGARIPLGVSYKFSTEPVDIFLELAPAVHVIGASGFHWTGSIGGRYWF